MKKEILDDELLKPFSDLGKNKRAETLVWYATHANSEEEAIEYVSEALERYAKAYALSVLPDESQDETGESWSGGFDEAIAWAKENIEGKGCVAIGKCGEHKCFRIDKR